MVLDRLHAARIRAVRRRPDRKLRHGHVRRASRALPLPPGDGGGRRGGSPEDRRHCDDDGGGGGRQGEGRDLVDGHVDDT